MYCPICKGKNIVKFKEKQEQEQYKINKNIEFKKVSDVIDEFLTIKTLYEIIQDLIKEQKQSPPTQEEKK